MHVQGPLSEQSWLDGIRKGHTFSSTGPSALPGRGRPRARRSDRPGRQRAAYPPRARRGGLDRADGQPGDRGQRRRCAQRTPRPTPCSILFNGDVPVPQGGWVAARVNGPSSRYISDSYAFAQTSPVYIVRGGRPWRSADDARFLADAVEATWQHVRNSAWRTPEERERFHTAIEQAHAVYERIAGSNADPAAGGASRSLLLDPRTRSGAGRRLPSGMRASRPPRATSW